MYLSPPRPALSRSGAKTDSSDYTTFAPHLRGRVLTNERGYIYIEVSNNGIPINVDGPYRTIFEAFTDVEARVHSARGAWMFSLSRNVENQYFKKGKNTQ